jgi:hypothetical protein
VTVNLGGNSYTGDTVMLTFVGDDANVHQGTTPVSYSEIDQGVATVTILNGTQVLQTASILPGQVVVTADHANNGFGFGFVPGGIGAGGFDPATVQPLYPAAISPTFVGGPYPDQIYDLTLGYAQAHAGQSGTGFSYGADGSAVLTAGLWICYDFQGTFASNCNLPAPILTDQGDFSITGSIQPWYASFRGIQFPLGVFTAEPLATNTVPEPGTLALIALALLVPQLARRRARA